VIVPREHGTGNHEKRRWLFDYVPIFHLRTIWDHVVKRPQVAKMSMEATR